MLFVAISASVSRGQQTSKVPATPSAAQITAAAVERLLIVGSESSTGEYLGIHRLDGQTRLLSINSARQNIVFSAASAASKGGTYKPPAGARADIVIISCGDEDLGERWDCGRLSVANSSGRRVLPLSYSSGAKTFRNALGASWTAWLVTATYRLQDLSSGFDVSFAGTDGTEFVEKISATVAASKLLTELPATRAMRDEAAARLKADKDAAAAAAAAAAKALIDAEPEPPPLLRGMLEGLAGDQWRITTAATGFTWKSCKLVTGIHSTPIGDLPPGAPVTVSRQSSGVPFSVSPVVQCVAKGKVFEGPVPNVFGISVEHPSASMWTARNRTAWTWKECEIVVAGKTAAVPLFPPNGVATVTDSDFRPGPPKADVTRTVADFTMSCLVSGLRVEAAQVKP